MTLIYVKNLETKPKNRKPVIHLRGLKAKQLFILTGMHLDYDNVRMKTDGYNQTVLLSSGQVWDHWAGDEEVTLVTMDCGNLRVKE